MLWRLWWGSGCIVLLLGLWRLILLLLWLLELGLRYLLLLYWYRLLYWLLLLLYWYLLLLYWYLLLLYDLLLGEGRRRACSMVSRPWLRHVGGGVVLLHSTVSLVHPLLMMMHVVLVGH